MNEYRNRNVGKVALAAAAICSGLLGSNAMASPVTWANTATDFNANGSWTGGVAPGTGNVATFGGTPTTNQPSLTANTSVQGISFGISGNPSWTVGGASILTLGTSGIENLGSGTATFNTNVAINGNQGWINTSSSNGNLIFNGVISGGTAGLPGTGTSVSLGRTGGFAGPTSGAVTINNANSYTGNTILVGGVTLNIGNDAALGTSVLRYQPSFGNSARITAFGASRTLSNVWENGFVVTGANDLTFNGNSATNSDTVGRDWTNSGTGKIFINGASTVSVKNMAFNGTGTFQIGGTTSNTSSTQDPTNGLVINNTLTEFNKTAGQSVTGGSVTVNAGSTARWLASNQMATGQRLNVVGTANLNGQSDSTSFITLTGGSVTGVANLNIVGGGSFDGTYSIVSNASSTTSTISGGTLALSKGFFNGRSGAIVALGTTASGIDLTISSVITSATGGSAGNGFDKTGAGTLALTGANTYAQGTMVNLGTLLVNNTTGSGTGTGSVTVANGATLGGTGTISGTVSVVSAGRLAPGNSVGTLNTGALTLTTGSISNYEFIGVGNNDFTNVTGGVTLTSGLLGGGGFNLYNNNVLTSYSTNGTYNLIGYSGTLANFTGGSQIGTGASAASFNVLNGVAGKRYTFGRTALSNGIVTLNIADAYSATLNNGSVGSPTGVVSITGSNGSYDFTPATGLSAITGTVNITGSSVTVLAPQHILLDLGDATQAGTVVSNLNALYGAGFASTTNSVLGTYNYKLTGGNVWDLALTFNAGSRVTPFNFAWDFTGIGIGGANVSVASVGVVPEPTSIALLGLGAIGLLRRRRR